MSKIKWIGKLQLEKVQDNCGDKNYACSKLILLFRTKYKFAKKGKEFIDVISFRRLFHLKWLHTERYSGQQLLAFLIIIKSDYLSV